jgi:hypothetical protein
MMEAVRTSEMLVYYSETTLRNIPEGYHFRHSENLKSHVSHNFMIGSGKQVVNAFDTS